MSKHKFPSPPPVVKKSTGDARNSATQPNTSVISVNTSINADTNPDTLVSWIDSLKARVNDTLTQQTSELQQLRISAKQEELRSRYRSHVFSEPFDKLGVYLEQEAHKQQRTELAVNDEKEASPFIEEEETALVKEYEYSPYPEEAPESEYQNEQDDSDVIEIISDEEDGEDDAKEQYAESESDLEIENSQEIENYDDNVDYDDNVEYDENVDYDEFEIEDHNDNDDETANVGKIIRYEESDDVQDEPQEEYPEYSDEFEGFEEEQQSSASRSVVSDDELEAYSSSRPKPSFQLKDGRPRLSDMSSYNYFQQDTNEYSEDDAEENSAKEEENEEIGKEEVASEENEDDQEEEERSPQSQIQPAPEDEVDSIIILSSGEEDATDSEDQPIVETQYYSEGRDDDSEEMVHSEMESSEVENFANHSQETEGSGTTESSKHLQSHIAESSGVESDAEQDLPNESNSKDLATYDDEYSAIHEVADENNLFANIAQEALVEEHIPLGTKINSDYLADVESDEPPKPVVSSEAGPISENEAKLHVEEKTSSNMENKTEVPNFDSANSSSQFDLGTSSGPKNEDEDASEGSLADAESDFRKMDDIPEENIPHPSLKFPIFKTIKSESSEEVLKKLEETEQKFHIKLHAVEELKSELGISEEPEEVTNVSDVLSGHPTEPNRLDAYSAADQSHATTFHDALSLDSSAMEDLEHIPSELTHSVLADLESDASLDAIVNEALSTHIPELDNASIDAILGGSELPRVEDEPVQESEDMEMENSEQVEAVESVEHLWEEEAIDQIPEESSPLSETEEGLVLLHETAEPGEASPSAGSTTPPPESSSELEVGADVLQVVSNFKSDLRAIEVPTLDEFAGATDYSIEEIGDGSEITEKSAEIEDDEFILEDDDKMSESEDVPAGEDLISEVEGDAENVDLDAGSAEEETETVTKTEAQADSKDCQVLPQEEAMIESTVSQPDIEQVAGEEETTPEIEEISSSDEVVAENVMQNVGPLGIGSDLDESSVRGEELSDFKNASFVPNDFHIPRYEKPSLPVLERIDSFSDEGVDVIEPKSPDEVIVEYDEFAVVEAEATTPTSIEEPTISAPEETIPVAVIATEVSLDTTADVETPTNIVEPTEVEEEILVEVFDDNSDVVTPSAILELESMRNTPVPVFSHAISVEEIREPQQPLSKKRKIDGDERSSFKRIKTAWTRLNPLNWFGLKDKQEESDEEQPQTVNNHGQAEYSDDSRGFQRSQNNEDRNENESENIDPEAAVEVDEDHDNALEILRESAIEVVEAISDDMSAVVDGDDENGGDQKNQALSEAIEHVKEAAHETFEAISEDIYAPVEGEDSEEITVGESLRDLGESVGETLDNLKEAGHGVIEALSEDITAPVEGEVVDKEGANDHIHDGGSESFGETIDHMKAAGEEVIHAISEEISAPVEGEEVEKAADETQEESSETLEQTLDHMIEAGIEVIETISEGISAPIEGDEVEKDDERHVGVSGNIIETIHYLEEAGKELTDAISESISAPVEGEEVNKTEELEDTHIDIAESLSETMTIVDEASKQFVDAISEDISAPFENEETRNVLELESAKEDAGTDMHTHVGKHFSESISRMKQAGKELVDAVSEEISAPVENEIVDNEFQKENESNESFSETVDQVKRAAQAVVEAVSEEISAPLSDQEDYASAEDEDAHTAKEETHVGATREFLDNLKGAAKGVYDELNEDLSVAVSSSDLTKDGTSAGEANQDYETDKKADLSFSETLSNIKKAAEEVVAAISEDILEPVADNIAENETGNIDAALLSPILDVPSDNSAFKVPTTADDDTTTTGPSIPPVPVFNLISPSVESLVSTKKSSEVPEILEEATDVHLDNNKSSKVTGTKVSDSKVQVLMDMFKKKAEALIEKHEHEDPDVEKPVASESEDLKTEQISRKQEDHEQSEDSMTDISDNEETTAEKAIRTKVQPASRKRSQRKRKVMGIDIGSDVDLTHRRALRSGATADEQEDNTDISTDKTESLGEVKKEQEFTSIETKGNTKPRRKLKLEAPEVKSDESKVLSRTDLLSPTQEVETGSPRKSKIVSSKPLELPKKRGRGRPPKKSKRNRATSSALEVGGTDSRTPSGKLDPSSLDHPALRTRSKSPIKRTIQELSLEIDEDQPRKKRVTRSAVQKRIEEVEAKKEEQGHDKDHEQNRRGRTRERH